MAMVLLCGNLNRSDVFNGGCRVTTIRGKSEKNNFFQGQEIVHPVGKILHFTWKFIPDSQLSGASERTEKKIYKIDVPFGVTLLY